MRLYKSNLEVSFQYQNRFSHNTSPKIISLTSRKQSIDKKTLYSPYT